MRSFIQAIGTELKGIDLQTVQVNVGYRCNQECHHCHHKAGPGRTEVMDRRTMEDVIGAVGSIGSPAIDITGGAPELNPNIEWFLTSLREEGHRIMLRTNLTALSTEGCEHLADFYRANDIELIASLPCYEAAIADAQRGKGVFGVSIAELRHLNLLGYGKKEGPPLNLVFNPGGAFLPAPQKELKEEYKKELWHNFGISFTDLFTITNMPMGRFLEDLRKNDQEKKYFKLLKDNFNPATLDSLMCRHQVNVGWDGVMYDCDFNQALDLRVSRSTGEHIRDLDPGTFTNREIVTGDHCFGCTAGSGSSCGGALLK